MPAVHLNLEELRTAHVIFISLWERFYQFLQDYLLICKNLSIGKIRGDGWRPEKVRDNFMNELRRRGTREEYQVPWIHTAISNIMTCIGRHPFDDLSDGELAHWSRVGAAAADRAITRRNEERKQASEQAKARAKEETDARAKERVEASRARGQAAAARAREQAAGHSPDPDKPWLANRIRTHQPHRVILKAQAVRRIILEVQNIAHQSPLQVTLRVETTSGLVISVQQ